MKRITFSILLTFFTTFIFANGVIVLEGVYQGKNIYVQNPFSASGIGFCVQEVRVNGDLTTDEIASSAFEIDLNNFGLRIGDDVEVKILHKDGCKPNVLNPEVLNPKSTFKIANISINGDFVLQWSTTLESGKLTYDVEQFRWNKWVKVGEVQGSGKPTLNKYSFKVVPHSGKNKFRVKQVDYTGQPRLSNTVETVSPIAGVSHSPAKVSKTLGFYVDKDVSVETLYEIYDQYGNIVKRGFASTVDAASLSKGVYYLNYDNVMTEFIKK